MASASSREVPSNSTRDSNVGASSRRWRSTAPIGARASELVRRLHEVIAQRQRRGRLRQASRSGAGDFPGETARFVNSSDEALELLPQRSVVNGVGLRPRFRVGAGVRIVGQPLEDAQPSQSGGDDLEPAIAQRRHTNDAGHRANRRTHVAATDLAPPLDQHDAELGHVGARQSRTSAR